jgi:peptide/nickel transport system permease protein
MRFLVTVWLALTLTFVALRLLPSDAIEAQLRQSTASQAEVERQRAYFGLNDPLWQQYGRYWLALLQGDLGYSLVTRESVWAMIQARYGATLSLAGLAWGWSLLLGVGLGSLAVYRHPWWGRLSQGLMTVALAAPLYWTATLVIYVESYPLRAFDLPQRQLILPVLVLGLGVAGGLARVVETSLHHTLNEAFIQTARAKGLSAWGVYRHALRASLPPIISLGSLQLGFLLSGTVIAEIIFTRRGLGSLLHQAVLSQDYPVVQALVLLAALTYSLLRGLAQALAGWADSRL